MFNYETTIDGMKLITAPENLNANDTIVVEDNLYPFEEAIFKVKSINQESADLKLVKLQTVQVISEEEKESFKVNKLYTTNLEQASLFHNEKLQINQPIFIGGKVFVVTHQEKKKGEPNRLELQEVNIKNVRNVYRVWRRHRLNYKLELFNSFNHWGTAFGEVMKMRSLKDEYFYFL